MGMRLGLHMRDVIVITFLGNFEAQPNGNRPHSTDIVTAFLRISCCVRMANGLG
jgi:hypothetical protein